MKISDLVPSVKASKMITAIQKLNDKLTVERVDSDAILVTHSEYGFICTISPDEDLDLIVEIVRDELFDKSEAAK